ncbi:Reverse transcriptase zinc-binding domain [Arabidopsis suecica]|uniref:Reverse transcriptase zinc-binding domain n=1 Tax=Arabidopsis suecica TaxID=45249 RepID=A0A8T2FC64_ARASU|nr:Reverse transcriptase zinc-binding domain [Arabidopsis suecica]
MSPFWVCDYDTIPFLIAVCLPKAEGGLGLRWFSEWNTTLNLKLVWWLFSGGGSLWVDWHRYHHLQGLGDASVSKFWTSQELVSDSWNWKCLLRLRPLAERFLRCNIGNGLTARFWTDNWTPFGPLLIHIGAAGPNRLRIPMEASVADATQGISWGLPVSPLCCLCSGAPETRDHLLLGCSFSKALWSSVQSRFRLHSLIFLNWAELLLWIRRSSTSAPSTLRKLVAHSVVYATWKQRNNMLHNSHHLDPASVFKIIDRKIINSINARRHKKKFRNLMSFWLI